MADQKISALTAITGANVDRTADLLAIVDTSATATKKILVDELRRALLLPGARVRKSADHTGQNYNDIAVAFNTEDWDVGGWHDNATDNTRLTVPSGIERVLVVAAAGASNVSTSANCHCYIIKNNTTLFPGWFVPSTNSGTMFWNATVIDACSASDYYEFHLFCSDTSIDIVAARTYFAIQAIG